MFLEVFAYAPPGTTEISLTRFLLSIFAFAIIALILQYFAKPADNDLCRDDRSLTGLGNWLCSVFAIMLIIDGYISSFLYHAPELTVFAG